MSKTLAVGWGWGRRIIFRLVLHYIALHQCSVRFSVWPLASPPGAAGVGLGGGARTGGTDGARAGLFTAGHGNSEAGAHHRGAAAAVLQPVARRLRRRRHHLPGRLHHQLHQVSRRRRSALMRESWEGSEPQQCEGEGLAYILYPCSEIFSHTKVRLPII